MTGTDSTQADPKGLIREAYRIKGITAGECRSIFLDWALSLPAGAQESAAAATLLRLYDDAPDHPMTAVLQQAASAPAAPARRRGGRAARFGDAPGHGG